MAFETIKQNINAKSFLFLQFPVFFIFIFISHHFQHNTNFCDFLLILCTFSCTSMYLMYFKALLCNYYIMYFMYLQNSFSILINPVSGRILKNVKIKFWIRYHPVASSTQNIKYYSSPHFSNYLSEYIFYPKVFWFFIYDE